MDLPSVRGEEAWPAQLRALARYTGGLRNLDSACLQQHAGPESSRCLFPEQAPAPRTPFFIANSLYDSSELGPTLELRSGCIYDPRRCSPAEMRSFRSLEETHRRGITAFAKNPRSGTLNARNPQQGAQIKGGEKCSGHYVVVFSAPWI